MLGEHLSQKVTLDQPYNPIFGQKRPPGGKKKKVKIFFAIFVIRLIKPLGKIIQTQKTY